MFVKFGGWVWEGLSTDVKPTKEDGAKDGHICKINDSGESFTMISGEWVSINQGLSFISATKSGLITTDKDGFYHVAFSTPFDINNYAVALTCAGSAFPVYASFGNVAGDGFDIQTRHTSDGGVAYPDITVSWLATRNFNPIP
jgi:hypothetical protein